MGFSFTSHSRHKPTKKSTARRYWESEVGRKYSFYVISCGKGVGYVNKLNWQLLRSESGVGPLVITVETEALPKLYNLTN